MFPLENGTASRQNRTVIQTRQYTAPETVANIYSERQLWIVLDDAAEAGSRRERTARSVVCCCAVCVGVYEKPLVHTVIISRVFSQYSILLSRKTHAPSEHHTPRSTQPKNYMV